jgi:hypothetical protein
MLKYDENGNIVIDNSEEFKKWLSSSEENCLHFTRLNSNNLILRQLYEIFEIENPDRILAIIESTYWKYISQYQTDKLNKFIKDIIKLKTENRSQSLEEIVNYLINSCIKFKSAISL